MFLDSARSLTRDAEGGEVYDQAETVGRRVETAGSDAVSSCREVLSGARAAPATVRQELTATSIAN